MYSICFQISGQFAELYCMCLGCGCVCVSVGEDRDKKWAKYEGYVGTHYLAINWIGGGGEYKLGQ